MPRGRAMGPGRLWKRGANWILDYRDAGGRRHQRSLGPKKADAERRRMEIIRRRDLELDGLGGIAGMDMALGDLVEAYLADLEPRVTRLHFRNVSGRLAKTVAALGPSTRIRDLRPLDVRQLVQQRVREGASHRTANLVGTTLQAALNWALDAGVIAASPIGKFKKLPETADHLACRRRALTDDEIERLLRAAEEDDADAAANRAYAHRIRIPQAPFWRALLDTGARFGELRQLTWGDVSFKEGVLAFRAESTKARKQRIIPTTQALAHDLERLRLVHQRRFARVPTAADHVFLSPRGDQWGSYSTNPMRILVRILDRAGIPKADLRGDKVDIHSLRHTFASRLARGGVGLAQAQRLLGHSDPKLTAGIYTHLAADDLRGAIASLDRPAASVRVG